MYLKHDHTYSTADIFKPFNKDLIKAKNKCNIIKVYKCRSKQALAQKIFNKFLYLMLIDLCTTKDTFDFPSGTASFKMIKIQGETFKEFRKKGVFKNVDLTISNFTGYVLTMQYKYTNGRHKTLYLSLSQNFRDLIDNMINTGFKYN